MCALLAAGLDGIKRQIDPGPPFEGDVGHMTQGEIDRHQFGFLPRTLPEALQALEQDELSRGGRPAISGQKPAPQEQLGLFQATSAAEERLRERLREVDINRTTPLEALQLLQDLKREAE